MHLSRRLVALAFDVTVALGTAGLPLTATSCELSTSAAQARVEASLSATVEHATTSSQTNARSQQTTTSASPAPLGTKTLTLASWNLQWLSAKELHGPVKRSTADYARLAQYARRLNADVIAVQEVDSVEALARVFDMTRYNAHVTADRSSQKTGFVYAKHLNVEVLPDYTALAAGSLRSGADIVVRFEHLSLRLLSVHLKSGCFDHPLASDAACVALGSQVPKLEAWIDGRASEHTPFAVVGDFNRRLFGRLSDAVWSALDDAQPPESDLDSPTRNQRSTCWDAKHPQFIDHLVLSRSLTTRAVPGSFKQLIYSEHDAPVRKQLSDHCPIAVTLSVGREGAVAHSSVLPPASSSVVVQNPIKGNVARDGKRLYHTVDCPNYARVKVEATKGERYFSSEEEAQKAGFTRAPGCRK